MTHLILPVAALLMASHVCAYAQDSLRPRYGVSGGLSVNMHAADFRALPRVPNCCPLFESGSGVGPLFGIRYEHPLATSLLLSIGVDYQDGSARLSTREPVAIAAGTEVAQGAFEHSIDATIGTLGIEPTVDFHLLDGLVLRAGLRLGAMLGPTYSQLEEIVEPVGVGTFLDSLGNDSGLRTRNATDGDLPDASSVLLQGVAGVEYELPINAANTLMLAPTVSYALALSDAVSGRSWRANALRVGITLKYSPIPSKEVMRDTVYRRDTTTRIVARDLPASVRLDNAEVDVRRTEEASFVMEHVTIRESYIRESPKASSVSSSLTAVGVDNGREEPVATLRVEEFLRTNTHPLLGFIFFADGSAEIPDRYRLLSATDAKRFKPETLFGEDAIGISHSVLNILGHNLRQHPQARLTITGCNAGVGQEQGNRGLSRARAESVKRYLVDVWGIAPQRLTVVDRDLPAVPSNTRTNDGAEENRRVEIASDDPQVIDVFVASDTTRTVSPPALRFKPRATSTEPIRAWSVAIRQRGTLLKEFSGQGTPPPTIDWEIASDRRNAPRFSEPLEVVLEVETSDGDRSRSQATLPTDVITVRQKESQKAKDVRIDQYNLVLFNVGQSTITPAHERTIQLIRSRMKESSRLTVEGFADRTGDDQANKRLALSRAQATAQALGRPDARVVGIGEDRLLYANDNPEGRFYCRTVQITVATPVER